MGLQTEGWLQSKGVRAPDPSLHHTPAEPQEQQTASALLSPAQSLAESSQRPLRRFTCVPRSRAMETEAQAGQMESCAQEHAARKCQSQVDRLWASRAPLLTARHWRLSEDERLGSWKGSTVATRPSQGRGGRQGTRRRCRQQGRWQSPRLPRSGSQADG